MGAMSTASDASTGHFTSVTRLPIPAAIEETRLVAILRHTAPDQAVKTAAALVAGGVRALEVTMNSEGALEMLRTIGEATDLRRLAGALPALERDEDA